jgi:hypothetical protein
MEGSGHGLVQFGAHLPGETAKSHRSAGTFQWILGHPGLSLLSFIDFTVPFYESFVRDRNSFVTVLLSRIA